jgi:hypothetical protein
VIVQRAFRKDTLTGGGGNRTRVPHSSDKGLGNSIALNRENQGQVSPDLAQIIETWACLPEPVKAGIVAMVKASANTEGN